MASQQWIPPLPAGIEARWDPNQKAFFFVDHKTKTTSWQDPRFPPKPIQDPKPQSQHQQAAKSLNQPSQLLSGDKSQNLALKTIFKQYGGTTTTKSDDDEDSSSECSNCEEDLDKYFKFLNTKEEEVTVDMTKVHEIKFKFRSAPDEVIKKHLKESNNSVTKTMDRLLDLGYSQEMGLFPPSKRASISKKLCAAFPEASPEIVNDVLEECHDDEKKARENLGSLGIKLEFPATDRVPSSTVSQKGSSTSAGQKGSSANGNQKGRATAGSWKSSVTTASQKATSVNGGQMKSTLAKSSRDKSLTPTALPVKPKLSEEQKQSITKKFQDMFKSCDKSVIEMALQVCEYDEARVKNVLERVNTGTESHPLAATTGGSSDRHTRSPSPVRIFDEASLEPIQLFDDEPRPGSSSSSKDSTPVRVSSAFKKSSDWLSRPSTGKSTMTVPQKSIATSLAALQSHQHRAKQVTHPGQGQTLTVVSRQPETSGYLSQNRMQTKGPDPLLHLGPNKNLLLTEYVLAKGPNPEMCQGHDPIRVKGSQGAVGPNKILHCGPQSNMVHGSSRENLLVSAM